MTVQDLIESLKKFDPKMRVTCHTPTPDVRVYDINSIELYKIADSEVVSLCESDSDIFSEYVGDNYN